MKLFSFLINLIKSNPQEIVETFEGVITNKIRQQEKTTSYNMALKPIYDNNYQRSPDRYDRFVLEINQKSIGVPLSVWNKVSINDKVILTIKSLKTGDSLFSAITDLSSVKYNIEIIK